MATKDYSEDWIKDSIYWWGKVLMGEYGHWCLEWDELPIDETCIEFAACKCYKEEGAEAYKEQRRSEIEEMWDATIEIMDIDIDNSPSYIRR